MAVKSPDEDRKKKIEKLSNAIARENDCDILIFNFGFEPGFEYAFQTFFRKRKTRRKSLLLFLTSEGGDADTAYRITRWLQDAYETITIVVAGWCKSAGTLVCIGANQLLMSDSGELGPLDVQIAKSDEIWGERSSGLVVEAAFEKLQEESFGLFFSHLMDLKEKAGRITLKTAAEIATQLVVGQTKEIFAKIDPLTVGEDYRSNLIAEQYAIRLNLRAGNLIQTTRVDGLRMLLRGYPSHRFIIDRNEATKLFRHVKVPTGNIAELATILERDILLPRSSSRKQPPKLEYLNAEDTSSAKGKRPAKGRGRSRRVSKEETGAGAENVRGRVPVRPEPSAERKKAA